MGDSILTALSGARRQAEAMSDPEDHDMRVMVGGVEFASASGRDYDEIWRTVWGYARGYADDEGEAVIEGVNS